MTLPRLREEDLPQLYGTYYPRKALTAELVARQAAQAQTLFARLTRWWMGGDNQGQFHVHRGEKMLDIGCGSGFSLLVAKGLGAEPYGVEPDPNVQKLASELGLRIHSGSIHDQPFPGISFDLVVLNQVIEHIPEPGRALEVIAGRLTPGGRVILVFPNRSSLWCRIFGKRWINWHVPYHLHHFEKQGFCQMAARYGLQMKRARTITPNLWTLLQVRSLRSEPIRGQPNPLWQVADAVPKESGGKRKHVKQDVKAIVLLLFVGAFGLVNRCIDLLGFGDSLMVELERQQDT